MPRLSFDRYAANFGRRTVFRDLSVQFDWPDGLTNRVIGLMGPSGSGKTTLLRNILTARYIEPVAGITVSPSDLVIGFVPQVPVLFNNMDIMANARMLQLMGRYANRFDNDLFSKLVDVLRLGSVLQEGKSLKGLSGGEMQRLMLLRTLSVKPDLLLLDEPASGLDPAVRETFLIDLCDLIDRLKIAALYIGHHWEEVSFVSSRIAYLVTSFDAKQEMVVSQIPVLDCAGFEAAPPTVDAFQTVYGPGCSLWPVALAGSRYALLGKSEAARSTTGLIACLPRSRRLGQVQQFVRAGPYRMVLVDKAANGPAHESSAWIYRGGEFLERSTIQIDDFAAH